MKKGYKNLEKVLVGCSRNGSRYLKHDIYFTQKDDDQPVLLATKYTAIDTEIQRRLNELVESESLYATEDIFREQYQGRRCLKCDHVVNSGDDSCWSCGGAL